MYNIALIAFALLAIVVYINFNQNSVDMPVNITSNVSDDRSNAVKLNKYSDGRLGNSCTAKYSMTVEPEIYPTNPWDDITVNPFAKGSDSLCRTNIQCKSGNCSNGYCK